MFVFTRLVYFSCAIQYSPLKWRSEYSCANPNILAISKELPPAQLIIRFAVMFVLFFKFILGPFSIEITSWFNKNVVPFFSDSVFNCKELKEYVSSGCPFGWIGHSVRKAELDKEIEEGLRLRGLSSSKMYNWISSSDGRHFGDSLDGLSSQEQIKEIHKNLNRMFNMCLIYGDENHTGLLSSSNKIREEMKQKGWLLNENE